MPFEVENNLWDDQSAYKSFVEGETDQVHMRIRTKKKSDVMIRFNDESPLKREEGKDVNNEKMIILPPAPFTLDTKCELTEMTKVDTWPVVTSWLGKKRSKYMMFDEKTKLSAV